jgi:DNA-binding transcriptional LysR family regulator
MTIRLAQLRKADLNLLVYLVVLMEEHTISGAARRLRLSQPSMSRALHRLRDLFQDELLTRTSKGYEPTSRGQSLLDEVAMLLPQIDRLITGVAFDPTRDRATFRVCATDNATQLYGPVLCREVAKSRVSYAFRSWTDDRFLDLERNKLELVLDAKMDLAPEHLQSEVLFEDEFVCVVAKDSPLPDRLSLSQYLAQDHIGVDVLHGRQTLPEIALMGAAKRRRCPITVPYFTVAIKMVETTPFLVTAPRRLAQAIADRSRTRLIRPPKQMTGFSYMMYWHPRQDRDPQHRWLRQTIRDATRSIPSI